MNLSLFLQGEICAGICLAEAVIIGSLGLTLSLNVRTYFFPYLSLRFSTSGKKGFPLLNVLFKETNDLHLAWTQGFYISTFSRLFSSMPYAPNECLKYQ